jgi:pimeloyl-ACP methyl ester carboxylesterase
MRLRANGIDIEADVQGAPDGEPLLLIMGLGMQLTAWPEPFVQGLVDRGFCVLRIDNRDIGLSQYFDAAGAPALVTATLRYAMGLPVRSAYRLADMAADALAAASALGWQRFHVAGASMGGMIAQHLAAQAPQRVKSLTLMMTSTGRRSLPQPNWRIRNLLVSRPDGRHEAAVVAHLLKVYSAIGSPGYPQDPQVLKERIIASVRRAWHPAGTGRQLLAIAADGDRREMLSRLQVRRTLVLHGQADPLVPVAAGHDLVRSIPAARGEFVPGWGHDLPPGIWPLLVDRLAGQAA